MSNLQDNKWYETLIDECRDVMTEGLFNHKWELIKCYHQLGKRIQDEEENMAISSLIKKVSKDLDINERDIWFSVKMVKEYPDVNSLPDGKAASWTGVKKLLSGGQTREECAHTTSKTIQICSGCNKRL